MLTKITAKSESNSNTLFSSILSFVKISYTVKDPNSAVIKNLNKGENSIQNDKCHQFGNNNDYISCVKGNIINQHEGPLAQSREEFQEKELFRNEMKYTKGENKVDKTNLEENVEKQVEENVDMLYKSIQDENGSFTELPHINTNFKGMNDNSIYFYSNILTLVYISSLSTYLFILLFGISKRSGLLKIVYMTNLISHCIIFIILDSLQLYEKNNLNDNSINDRNENNKFIFLLQDESRLHNFELKHRNINFYFKANFNNSYIINNKNGFSFFPSNYSLFLLHFHKFLSTQKLPGDENFKLCEGERCSVISKLNGEMHKEKKEQPKEIDENYNQVGSKFSEKGNIINAEQKESLFINEKNDNSNFSNVDISNTYKKDVSESNFKGFNEESTINGNKYLWNSFTLLYLFIIISSVCSGYINIYQKRILYCIFYINIGSITSFLILINSIFKLLAHFLNYFFTYELGRRISDYVFLFLIIDLIGLAMITIFQCMWNNQKYLWVNLHKIFYNYKYVCFYLSNTYYIYSTDKNIDNILVNIDIHSNKNIEISFCAYTNLEKSVFCEYFILNRFKKHKLKILEIKDKNFKIESTYKGKSVILESRACRKSKSECSKNRNEIYKRDTDKYNRRKKQSSTMKPYSICIETLNSNDNYAEKLTELNTLKNEIERTKIEMENTKELLNKEDISDKWETNEINKINKNNVEVETEQMNNNKDIPIPYHCDEYVSLNFFNEIKDNKVEHMDNKEIEIGNMCFPLHAESSLLKEKNYTSNNNCDDMSNFNKELLILENNNKHKEESTNISYATEKKKETYFNTKNYQGSSMLNAFPISQKNDIIGNSIIENEQKNEKIGNKNCIEKNILTIETDLKKSKSIKFQPKIEEDDDRKKELEYSMKTVEIVDEENEKTKIDKKKNVLLIPDYDEILNEDVKEEEDIYYEDFGINYVTNEFPSLHSNYKENINSKISKNIKAYLSSYTFSFFFFTFTYAFLLSIIHIFVNYFFYIYLFVFNINIYVSNIYTIIMTGVSLLAIPFSGYIIDHIGAIFSLLLCSSFFITIAVSGTIYSYKNKLNSEVLAILFFNLIGISESIIPTVIISQIPTHLCVKNNEHIPSAFAIFELFSMIIISLSNYIFGVFLRKSEYLQGLYILFGLIVLVMCLILALILKTYFTNKRKQNTSYESLSSCGLGQPLI